MWFHLLLPHHVFGFLLPSLWLCPSATNISVAVSIRPSSDPRAERNISELHLQLRSQLQWVNGSPKTQKKTVLHLRLLPPSWPTSCRCTVSSRGSASPVWWKLMFLLEKLQRWFFSLAWQDEQYSTILLEWGKWEFYPQFDKDGKWFSRFLWVLGWTRGKTLVVNPCYRETSACISQQQDKFFLIIFFGQYHSLHRRSRPV